LVEIAIYTKLLQKLWCDHDWKFLSQKLVIYQKSLTSMVGVGRSDFGYLWESSSARNHYQKSLFIPISIPVTNEVVSTGTIGYCYCFTTLPNFFSDNQIVFGNCKFKYSVFMSDRRRNKEIDMQICKANSSSVWALLLCVHKTGAFKFCKAVNF